MEIVPSADAGEFQRALHHAERRVAVAVHDAVAERAVIGSDAHGALQLLAEFHQRREAFLHALHLGGVRLVGVILDDEFLLVGVIARVDTDHFDPFGRFHGGLRLEMNVGHEGHEAAARAQFGDDVPQIGRVPHRRRGDAHELATDLDEFERLLHTGGGVHCVAGEHRLLHHRVAAAQDEPAILRITHHDFAALAPPVEIRRFAVAHGNYLAGSGAGAASFLGANLISGG